MREAGRLSGAIEVMEAFEAQHVPLKTCLTDWGRAHRFAGSGDRSWISSLCHDVVRRRQSLAHRMQSDSSRAACLGALRDIWAWDTERIADVAAEEPYGPGPLETHETAALEAAQPHSDSDIATQADFPAWVLPHLDIPEETLVAEGQAMAARAPVDLRVNSLKADTEKARKNLNKVNAQATDFIETALRIAPPAAHQKSPALEAMPAFAKGWIEVQDLGSQLVTLAAGNISGKQVLDYCAGAGGKTLALASLANNTGQIFAYDVEPRRLAPIFDRMRRAGTRNIQVRSPAEEATLDGLVGAMDVVFVDAPCSGSGTWRRKPDSKWRLTPEQLDRRHSQQDEALAAASQFVKSGGLLVYVTCSIISTENRARVDHFLTQNGGFTETDTLNHMQQTGLLKEYAAEQLRRHQSSQGSLQLTPYRTGTDGFFVSTLVKKG
ncbi:MAG: RsmB/NOP family class I SAM-dependent RNA methyltransferase [Aquisalinus sp.]|nr:RsmB/NOP family class I SAM-dependent RNA methyltransferase [Aquisalinus sp.]